MGTVVTFDVYCVSGHRASDLYVRLARARSLLRRCDAIFTLWNPNSPMSRVRRGELEVGDAPSDVAAVLDLCSQAREATRGWFDPFALPGGVDPTGLVKGWATQKALEVMVDGGYRDCVVNAGGDIATSGSPHGCGPWRIGIRHPASPQHLLGVVEVTGAIATSGTYERGAHLIDPHTGRHVARFASASVTGLDLALADAVATGLAVAGDEGFDFVEALTGYEGFAVRLDGSTRASAGWHFAAAEPSTDPLCAEDLC
jgi:thiamine biosynthesis lipoprotein